MERPRPDWYRVLQVDPAANPLVIQAAYRVLAQIFHPDVSGDDAEMKKINAAWEVIGDPRRRRQYDMERAGRHPGRAQHAASDGPSSPGYAEAPLHADPGQHAGRGRGHAEPEPAASASPATSSAGHAARPTQPLAHAGAPRGEPFGPLLKFGRYEGWTLGQVSRVDRPYLEWLGRAPAGRGFRDEIDAVLLTRRGPGAVDERRTYEGAQRRQVHTWAPGAPTKLR